MRRREFGIAALGAGLTLPIGGARAARPADMTAWVAEQLRNDATVLRLPPGEHHFHGEHAQRLFLRPSNNDPGESPVIFPLNRRRKLLVEGNGARLVFHGRVTPFTIIGSSDITLRDLTIDWQIPFHCEGDIERVDPAGKWVELFIPEPFGYRIAADGSFFFKGEGFEQEGFKNLLEFDAKRKESGFRVRDNYPKSRNDDGRRKYTAAEIGPRRIRIALEKGFATPLTLGNRLLIMPPDRLASGIFIADSRRVTLERVTIRHAGSMGVIAQMSEDIALQDCEVAPDPTGGRYVSTTVDATHFVNCNGLVRISGCRFGNHIDDAVNIHGIFQRILRQETDGTIVAERSERQQRGIETVRQGDEIALSDAMSVTEFHRARVTEISYPDDRLVMLKLDRAPPRTVADGDVINTVSRQPRALIERCTIGKNRARGILVSTAGEVVIRGNRFHTPGAAIRVSGGVDFWYESGPTSNVLITGNIFDNCRYGVWGKAVIDVECVDGKRGAFDTPFHGTVRIEDNRFITFDPALVSAYRARRIVFARNRIERSDAYPAPKKLPSPVTLEAVGEIEMRDNRIIGFKFDQMLQGDAGAPKRLKVIRLRRPAPRQA